MHKITFKWNVLFIKINKAANMNWEMKKFAVPRRHAPQTFSNENRPQVLNSKVIACSYENEKKMLIMAFEICISYDLPCLSHVVKGLRDTPY